MAPISVLALLGAGLLTTTAALDLHAAVPAVATNSTTSIGWIKSYKGGLDEAKRLAKPLLVDFYADWCGPCRLMEASVFSDPRIVRLAADFVCAKVNVDEDTKTALKFKVNTIPRVMVLRPDGKPALDGSGFMDVERLGKFLEQAKQRLAGRDDPGEAIDLDHVKRLLTKPGGTGQVIELLGQPQTNRRMAVAEAVRKLGRDALPLLLEALENEYLGVRITATDILRELGYQSLPDPWAPRLERAAAIAKLKQSPLRDSK